MARVWGEDPVADRVDSILAHGFFDAYAGRIPVHHDDEPEEEEADDE